MAHGSRAAVGSSQAGSRRLTYLARGVGQSNEIPLRRPDQENDLLGQLLLSHHPEGWETGRKTQHTGGPATTPQSEGGGALGTGLGRKNGTPTGPGKATRLGLGGPATLCRRAQHPPLRSAPPRPAARSRNFRRRGVLARGKKWLAGWEGGAGRGRMGGAWVRDGRGKGGLGAELARVLAPGADGGVSLGQPASTMREARFQVSAIFIVIHCCRGKDLQRFGSETLETL